MIIFYFSAPFDISKESELYKTASEELNCSDELYHTAINITQNTTASEFHSTVEQLYVNACIIYLYLILMCKHNLFHI